MLRKQYCICQCFYYKNLYLKSYGIHFEYKNKHSFRSKYPEVLKYMNEDEIQSIEEKLTDEIKRRKTLISTSHERKKLIEKSYSPLHPSLYALHESFFNPLFLRMVESASRDILATPREIKDLPGELYAFPVFTPQFCDKFLEELKHYEASSIPKQSPNSMNKYGVNVDELGFEPLISELRTKYLRPLTRLLFPEWGGGSLDSHKAFVIAYKGEDLDLAYHYDNAEVTLNISLNDDFSGGEVYFGPMRNEESSFRYGYEHIKANGLLHRGQQMHGAFPITEGERYNLIVWMRSSEIRNEKCPMCDEVPSLEPVNNGTGDGFTMTIDDICSMG